MLLRALLLRCCVWRLCSAGRRQNDTAPASDTHYAAPPQPPPQNATGFVPYAGEGFAILLPSRWNPSKEDDYGKFAKTQLR